MQLVELPRIRLCVDYRALNNVLPPVTKDHSKANGVFTLVPLPKLTRYMLDYLAQKSTPP